MAKDLKVIHGNACQLFLDNESKLITGTHRLGQKFIIELLTKRGSMKFLPTRGCSFLARVYQLAITELDIIVAFTTAKQQIKRNFKSDESSTTPPSECFSSATLNKITVDNGFLLLEIDVRSRAGTTVRMQTPPIPMNEIEDEYLG